MSNPTPRPIEEQIGVLGNAILTIFLSVWLIGWSLGVGFIGKEVAGKGLHSYFMLIFLLTHGGAEVLVTRIVTGRILAMLGTASTTISDAFSETGVTISRAPRSLILFLGMIAQIVVVGTILLGGTWAPALQGGSTKSVITGMLLTLLWWIFIGRPWKTALKTLWEKLHSIDLTFSNDGLTVTRRGPFLEQTNTIEPDGLSTKDGPDGTIILQYRGQSMSRNTKRVEVDEEEITFVGETGARIRSLVREITDHNIDNPIIMTAVPDEIKQMRATDIQHSQSKPPPK